MTTTASASPYPTIDIGTVTLHDLQEWRPVTGNTIGKKHSTGQAYCYRVTGSQRLQLDLEEVLWDNGEWEIRCVDAHSSPKPLHRLEHGLRLGVRRLPRNRRCAQLRLARLGNGDWSNVYKTYPAEVARAAKFDPHKLLVAHGATAYTDAEHAYGETNRRKGDLAVVFEGDQSYVAVLAYAITRVLPLLNRFTG